ncbi:Hypothetical predicted protein [Paramuricea clavata]|uniref:Uncharacterized protein n=1 Tax=Paramuricea clavata TaxID=317549 RepID=A0A7D9DF40_PARCT|nr:Hypothetical predicted protein [Paramuricea clavata]
MDAFYEEISLAEKSYRQHLGNVQAIIHLLDPIQTINNSQSGHLDGKNHSLSKSYKLWLAKHHPDKAKAKGEAGLEETDFIKEYGNILLKTNNKLKNLTRYKNSIKNALRAVRQYNDECDVGCLKEGEIIDQQTYSRDFPSTGSVFDFGVRKNLANPKIDQLSSILKKREEKNIPLVVTRVKWNDEKSNCSLVGDYRVLCYIPEQDCIEIQLMSPVDDLGSKCKISSVVIDAFEKLLELLRSCVVFLKKKRDLEEQNCHRYKSLGFFQY